MAPRYETRAAKRARTSCGLVPLTPQSMPPSTPPQVIEAATAPSIHPSTLPQTTTTEHSNSIDAGSSPLSSIDSPEPVFEFNSRSMNDHTGTQAESASSETIIESQPVQPKSRKQRNKKEGEEDDDFSPSHNLRDNLKDTFQHEQMTKNSNTAGKRKAAPRKTPNAPYHISNQDGKPEPHGQPGIWADKRQQLCETLPYYKAYQGSAYTKNHTVFGILIDKEVEDRDKFDEEVIITSCGGGKSADETGKRVRIEDQLPKKADPYVSSMIKKQPIAMIAGQGNAKSPSKLPHVYNVLDWFHVTDVWAEKSGPKGHIAWRVRLERICPIEKSWWAIKGSPDLPQDSSVGYSNADSKTCADCGTSSKVKYNAGWACLKYGCGSFFQFENGYNDATLDYSDEWMQERTSYQGPAPGPLSKPLPTEQDMTEMDAYGFEKTFKGGIVCPKCGCCSRRIVWDHWYCENSHCDFTYTLKQKIISLDDVIAKAMQSMDKPPSDQIDAEVVRGGVIRSHSVYGPWNINEYAIPDEDGKTIGFVRHFKSNGMINQQTNGPNELFKQMQGGEFALRRNPARQANSVGETLTSHFAANFVGGLLGWSCRRADLDFQGAQYKYGVKQLSKGFNDAPEVILKTIKRLTWAGEVTVVDKQEAFQPFNECLSIGYFEGSVINYHDDGEKTLGPTVATLSLGAPAKMSFRPKLNNTLGKSEAKSKIAVLQFTLEHGDIVIMHGEPIQKLYEHAVTPWGFRYALTCRFIIKENMDTPEERRAAMIEGTLPQRSEKYTYDGDLNAAECVQSASEVDKMVNNITAKLKIGELTASQVSEIKEKLATMLSSYDTRPGTAVEEVPQDIAMPDAR